MLATQGFAFNHGILLDVVQSPVAPSYSDPQCQPLEVFAVGHGRNQSRNTAQSVAVEQTPK